MKPDEQWPTVGVFLRLKDYDLAATLNSGQVFRWQKFGDSWVGVVGTYRVRLRQLTGGFVVETDSRIKDWDWMPVYLQTNVDLEKILATFPDDEPMNRAVTACRGLRVLRQEPWECLASFILSATKQIVQIRQIVARLCICFGEEIVSSTINGHSVEMPKDLCHAFPSAEKIAGLTEKDLRDCRMGFRAPNLLAAARQIAEGKLDLESLRHKSYQEARVELMKLRGVGEKIADCVLLFAYGFDSAFPVDVWVERALRTLYFPRRRVNEDALLKFAATHFGPHAGYAQQYLFHYMRTCHES
ncbi:MAG TPA: DNA glycosylase [Verrucomicrobiae bacterium]|jgi:N-glycosylase/DNA lyase|nr:DNA glycosylase [Verrucomicrobiae bacterium]